VRWYRRLRRSGEIAFVRRRGRQAGTTTLSAYALPAAGSETKVCISASKAVGGAVVRNLIRRRVRGALDALGPPGRDLRLLFVLRPAAASAPFERLAADLAAAVRRLAADP